MKKWISMALVTTLLATTVMAAPGDTNDPVISQSYVNQVFRPQLVSQLEESGTATMENAYRQGLLDLVDTIGEYQLNQTSTMVKSAGTVLLKKGDVVTLDVGTQLMVQDGTVVNQSANLVDITSGAKAPLATLTTNHRYMMGAAPGTMQVTSGSCQVTIHGVYTKQASNGVDYGSMALGLQTMGLFQGTDGGFQLEQGATRVQGLVMFLRILGLEDEALACTASVPFRDVPTSHWARKYVAYAYQEGLTTGTSTTTFSPDMAMTSQHYLTFLMRALAYDEGSDFTFDTALNDTADLKLFTAKEVSTLSSGTFLRRDMAYLSFYSLFAMEQSSGDLLMEKLVADGAIRKNDLYNGICQIQSGRIS